MQSKPEFRTMLAIYHFLQFCILNADLKLLVMRLRTLSVHVAYFPTAVNINLGKYAEKWANFHFDMRAYWHFQNYSSLSADV